MGMFSKLVAFLDKAAGVPAWITHAENIRKLEERGCPVLAKAIVENPSFHHMGAYTIGQIAQQLAEDYKGVDAGNLSPELREFSRSIAREIIAASEGPVEGPLRVLYDFVGKDALPTIEIVDVEVVLTLPEDASAIELVQGEQPEQTLSPTTAPDLDNLDTDAIPLDEAAKAQLLQGMMAVISRGRKPEPTLKVLNNMSMGDKGLIIEALSAMEARGNSLAKAILEDPSL